MFEYDVPLTFQEIDTTIDSSTNNCAETSSFSLIYFNKYYSDKMSKENICFLPGRIIIEMVHRVVISVVVVKLTVQRL